MKASLRRFGVFVWLFKALAVALPLLGVTVTDPEPIMLRRAIETGGEVTLAFDDLVKLTNAFFITTDTTVDATGHAVTLDGDRTTRHFLVTNGVTLRLVNLVLQNGRFAGAEGATNTPGNPGSGGSIYNVGGRLELIQCRFINNQALGGNGGPTPAISYAGTTGGPGLGGAVYCTNGTLWAWDCFFVSNRATGGQGTGDQTYTAPGGDAFGGAIFSAQGTATLAGVIFTNNAAQSGPLGFRPVTGGRPDGGDGRCFGGAFADTGATVWITNSLFVANLALGGIRALSPGTNSGNAYAGALFHDGGFATISRTLFCSNSATGGGGINRGGLTIYAADGSGGAVFNGAGRLQLQNSAFVSNQAKGGTATNLMFPQLFPVIGGNGKGGGIYNQGALALVNCTLAENGASGGSANAGNPWPSNLTPGNALGGGLFNESGAVSLLNVTVASNTAQIDNYSMTNWPPPPRAQAASIFGMSGPIILTNTILSCLSSQTNVSGSITDGGHNLCSDRSAKFTSAFSLNEVDPWLAPLADNGGSIPTMALLPASPAVDAGDDSVCPAADQRGVARPQGAACDIGAYELAPGLAVVRGEPGVIKLDYSFAAERTSAITASTNLVDWVQLGTQVTDANGRFEFEDSESALLPWRFYRVIMPLRPLSNANARR